MCRAVRAGLHVRERAREQARRDVNPEAAAHTVHICRTVWLEGRESFGSVWLWACRGLGSGNPTARSACVLVCAMSVGACLFVGEGPDREC